jgi:hypothetical protein
VVDSAVAIVAVLLWLTAAFEGVHVVRRKATDPAMHMLALTFALLAVSATFFIPAVHLASGRVSGIPNVGEPIARTALNGAAWSVQVFLLRLNDPAAARARARSRALFLIAVLVAQWTLFLTAPVERPTRMFTRDYGSTPGVAAYLIVALTYLAVALADVIYGTRRYHRSATGSLATGLRLIGLGCWFGLGYITVKATFLVVLTRGSRTGSGVESVTGRLLAVAGAGLIIAGSLLPPLAARIRKVHRWATAYRQRRQLFPLWQLLYRAEPGIALDPPASALHDAFRVRDAELLLYRRVIEIRDGRLALAAHLDPRLVAATRETANRAGLAAVDADATAEAAALRDAAEAKQSDSSDTRDGTITSPSPDNATTLSEEVDWLLRVTQHLHHLDRSRGQRSSTTTITSPSRTAT